MGRWTCLVAALALAVTAAACGDDDEKGDTTPTTTTTAVPTTIPTTAQLEAMLLTADDIEGWQVGEDINPQDLASSSQLPCEGVTLDPAVAERLIAETGVQFVPAGEQYANLIELLITGDAAQLEDDLHAYREAFQSCLAATSTTSDTQVGGRELSLPDLGDQQWAYAVTMGGKPVGYSSYVRVGSVAVNLGVYEPLFEGETESKIGDDEFVTLLETAIAKVSG